MYVNGVFTDRQQAEKDLRVLENDFKVTYPDSKTNFINGYNPSHLGGAGDLVQSAAQLKGKSILSFDRDTILLQIYPQVTTRKLLIVGHSQGSFYSNAIYEYLLAHGEPREAVGVYQVGSPASYVAGGGKYLNSSSDVLLITLRGLGVKFLPNNIDLAWSSADAQGEFPGHSFSGAYLAEAPDRIVGDIQSTLKNLKPTWASNTGDCFDAPDAGISYMATKVGFAVADTAANGVKTGAGAAKVAAVAAGNALAAAVQGVYGVANKLAADIGITVGGVAGLTHAAEPSKAQTNFDILSKFYGSSLSKDDYKELMGGAVATAPVFASAPAPAAAPQPALAQDTQGSGPAPADTPVRLLAGSGGARHKSAPDVSPAPEAPVAESSIDIAPAVSDAATTTDPIATTTSSEGEATSTPEVPSPHFAPAISPVADSFDGYDGSGWTTYGNPSPFGGNPVPFFATTTDCHSGGCLDSNPISGGGATRMYKTGAPTSEGSVVIWKKVRYGLQGVGNVWLMVCVGAPTSYHMPCEGTADISRDGPHDVWVRYFVAWRNNGNVKEFCHMRDEIDQERCIWEPSNNIAVGDAPDTIALSGDAVRLDYGDMLWFDDLGTP